METDERKFWGTLWAIVACIGIIAVICGQTHHIMTFVIGLAMAIVAGREDDDNQLKPR